MTEENQNLELTVNDLAAIRQVIEVAQARGAFKPGELVAVGTVYEKLNTFLEAVAANQQSANEASNEAVDEAQAEETGE